MNTGRDYLDYAVKQIVNLCNTPSPSGFTKYAEEYLVNELESFGYRTIRSKKGSVSVDMGGEGNGLVLVAHIDTLGAMVRTVKENGRLRLTKIGSYPESNIERENCLVHTRTGKVYSGTIFLTKASSHVFDDISGIKRNEENLEILLDEIVCSKPDVLNLGVSAGDFITFEPRTVITESGFIKSRHLDGKASVGILLALAKLVKDRTARLNRKTWLLFTTYEEVGHGGAAGIPAGIDEIIAVDMGVIGDDLQTNEYKVSICAKDTYGPYDYDITTNLISIAKNMQLDYAVDIYPRYGSDVDISLRAGYDIKHGLIGPGVYASHGYERTHLEGIKNTFKLVMGYTLSEEVNWNTSI